MFSPRVVDAAASSMPDNIYFYFYIAAAPRLRRVRRELAVIAQTTIRRRPLIITALERLRRA